MEDNPFLEFSRNNEKEGVMILLFALLSLFGDTLLPEPPTLEE